MRNNKGFTVPELMFAVIALIAVAFWSGLIYVAYHFISKMW